MLRPLLLTALLCACAPKTGSTDALRAYLEAEQSGRYEAAHRLLTPEDRTARPLEEYVREHLSAGPIWLAVARRTRFKIERRLQDDTRARFDVEATHPDMDAVADAVPGLPPEVLATSPDPAAEMRAHVESTLASRPFPQRTEELNYEVRNTTEGYRVWLALAKQDEALESFTRGKKLWESGDRESAAEAWTSLMAVAADPSGVVKMLQDEVRRVQAEAR